MMQNKTAAVLGGKRNSYWREKIPTINRIFGVIFLLLVFGLDLLLILSDPELVSFWYVMLFVFAVFALFYFLENHVFCRRFQNHSGYDAWISLLIVIRNLIFLLNFIPFIQLLGILAIVSVGWGVLLIYIILMILRFVSAGSRAA